MVCKFASDGKKSAFQIEVVYVQYVTSPHFEMDSDLINFF